MFRLAAFQTPRILGSCSYTMFTAQCECEGGKAVFASAGIPVECVAVAAGIDRIIDMGRTVMSVTGDASCSIVMQRLMGNKL